MDYDLTGFQKSLNPMHLVAHENKMIDELVYKKNVSKMEEIGRIKYDVAMATLLPFEVMVAKMFNLPLARWHSYTPDPVYTVTS